MKIVVLDGYTLNPGDLDWSPLRALGNCEIHDRTRPEDVLPRVADAGAVLTNKVVLDRARLAQLPALRYIGVLATGYNVVDAVAARERGIAVTNVPAYSTPSVAQTVFALLLEWTHRVGHHAGAVRAGGWTRCADFAFWDYPLIELAGRTMGLVGFGQTGQAVARVAQAFGMRVIAHRRDASRPAEVDGVQIVDLNTLFGESDVVSLHCPLTDATRGLVNAARLAQMKSTAFLINTSRGPVIVEKELAEALNAGRIAGAGLDVLSQEPPPADNPLLSVENCFITPHFAWASEAARQRLLTVATDNLRAFLAGQPQNVVN